MAHYVCHNMECTEVDVAKEAPELYEQSVQCGVCGDDCEGVE